MITKDEALKRLKDDFWGEDSFGGGDYEFMHDVHFGRWGGGFDADMVVRLESYGEKRTIAVVKCREKYDNYNYRMDMSEFLEAFADYDVMPRLFLVDLSRGGCSWLHGYSNFPLVCHMLYEHKSWNDHFKR